MTDTSQPSWIEEWIAKNSGWLALGVIVVGFAIRVLYASSCYLNPDEAEHFAAARPSTWFAAYQASLRLWHPPLFILVLHGFLYLGRSELILRMPSLIAGTAALWFAFAWMRRVLNEVPALFGLIFLVFSPAAISVSTEVRQYGLLLFFTCAALYATERAFADRSVAWTIFQGLMLAGALLTHYTAVIVLASVGLYALLRSVLDAVPRRILWTFVANQFVLAGILGLLYFVQVRRVIPVGPGTTSYLSADYYVPSRETLLAFTWKALTGIFAWALSRRLAVALILTFVAGIAAMLASRIKVTRLLPLLLISPFIAGYIAGVVQVLPFAGFAGSRYETYLLPFMVTGISAALAWLRRQQAIAALVVFAVLAPPLSLVREAPDNDPRRMPKSDMAATVEFIRTTIPQGSLVFVDYGTRDELSYYLARNDKSLDTWRPRVPDEERAAGYRVVVPRINSPYFRPDQVLEPVAEAAGSLNVPPGDPLWIVSVAWERSPALASELPTPKHGIIETKEFGHISVIKVSNWQ